ncbi:MAG: hypothetical protein Q8P97_01560 [bacterium]|nr:hypothetical protein [bacterium]
MEQVAIFCCDRELYKLEERINTWLTKMGEKIEIIRVMQSYSIAPSGVEVIILAIFYKKIYKNKKK